MALKSNIVACYFIKNINSSASGKYGQRNGTKNKVSFSKIHCSLLFPSLAGFQYYMKYFSLVTLMVQNVSVIILMRYVRIRPGDMFTSSTAVIMQEVCKFLTCLFIILVQQGSVFKWALHLKENIFSDPWDNVKIAVPSIVYTLQNNLLYVAVSNLDAATFQVRKISTRFNIFTDLRNCCLDL